jgi:hypothetical protein
MSARTRQYKKDRRQTTEGEAAILWEFNAKYWQEPTGEFRRQFGAAGLAKVRLEIKQACTKKLKQVLNSTWEEGKVREWFDRHSPKALARVGRLSDLVGKAAHSSWWAEDSGPLIEGDRSSAPRGELAKPVGNPECRPEPVPVRVCAFTELDEVNWLMMMHESSDDNIDQGSFW